MGQKKTNPYPEMRRVRPTKKKRRKTHPINQAWGTSDDVRWLPEALGVFVPPPERRKGLLLGIDVVQRVTVEELAVFHDVADAGGVVDIVERIFVEHDEIGELARLDGAEVLLEAHGFGASQGGGAQHIHVGSAAGCERPHLPVIAESLELTVAANADLAAGPDELGVLRSEARKGEFVLARPDAAAARAVVNDIVRKEAADLGVVVDFGGFVEIIFGPGTAISDDERGGVEDARARPELYGVVEQRRYGDAVLVAAEAVDGVGEVELHVEGAFGGGHDAFFFASHDHPLALLAVADEIRLEIGGAIELAVAADDIVGVVERLEVGVRENAGAGGVRTRADDFAGVDHVLVGEHVVGGGLRVAACSNAIGEIGEEGPVLEIENAAADLEPVRVNVNETGDDGLAGDVDDFRRGGNGDAAGFADGDDAIVFHYDVGVFEHVVTVHGDDARAAQHGLTGRRVTREGEIHGDDFGLQFGEFLLVLGFSFVGLPVFALCGGLCFLGRLFGGLGFFFRGRGEFDLVVGQAEVRGAFGPGQGFAAVGEVAVVGADFADFAERHGGFGDVYDQRFGARARDGEKVSLIADLRECPLAVGADAHIVGGIAFGMLGSGEPGFADDLEDRAAIRAVIAQRDQTVFGIDVNAVGLRTEVGMAGAARGQDEIDVAAIGR